MEVVIKWGFSEEQRMSIAMMLYESLGDKLNPVFGRDERGIACVASILQSERLLLAMADNEVLGIAGLMFRDLGYMDSSLRILRKHLGWGIFRAMFNGWLLEHRAKKDELYLDTIAVSEQARGHGIGSKLLQEVIDFGCKEGFSYLKLSVIDTNPWAKSLYERMGFRVEAIQKMPYPWSRTFGFSSAIDMKLEL
ncbi:MAG: GNAT family N-acetyltransferase [Candidatus Thorarchaeota archaeon]|jgi:ribosomal protein S18 acetylase RimI-like enzyme